MITHIQATLLASFDYCISLDLYGNIWCVGMNNDNLGNNKVKYFYQFTKISSITNIKSISCGSTHIICLNYDNEVFSFGNNNKGQLGIGKDENECTQTHIPQKVNLPPIKQISSGNSFNICISEQGHMYSFGSNSDGQLGVKRKSSSLPIKIPDLNDIEFGICGRNSVLCKTFNNQYYSWGYGYYGELGNGQNTATLVPTLCEKIPDNIISIKCGYFHTLLLSDEGQVYSCGLNSSGQLGLPEGNVNIPTLIKDIPEIIRIECGGYHSICIDINNNLWVFGGNSSGQLGLGDKENIQKPRKHSTLNDITDISSGGYTTFVKTLDNKIYAFGKNNKSQLGIKTSNNEQLTPIQVLKDNEDIWASNIIKSRQKSARK